MQMQRDLLKYKLDDITDHKDFDVFFCVLSLSLLDMVDTKVTILV